MTMARARWLVVLLGIALPYLARLPGGLDWLRQYIEPGLPAALFLGVFNAVAWGAILGVSRLYRRPLSLLAPCLFGFGFLAWGHARLDLTSDAQAAVGLVFLPIYALLPIAVGAGAGYVIDRKLRKADRGPPGSRAQS